MDWNLPYPEIDTRPFFGDEFRLKWGHKLLDTILDVLDVYQTPEAELGAAFEQGLGHDDFVRHVEANKKPALRVIFIPCHPLYADSEEVDPPIALHPSTAEYLINKFNVSPTFIATITTDVWVLKSGNGRFHRKDSGGNLAITGFYRFETGGLNRGTHISSNTWFSHELKGGNRTSLYIIRNCSQEIKDNLLRIARCPALISSLLRPLAVDALIADASASAWGREFIELRAKLVDNERRSPSELKPRLNQAIQDLHTLSQEFHILQVNLDELMERIQYLIGVHKAVSSRSRKSRSPNPTPSESPTSVADSLSYLKSKVTIWHRWSHNYTNRVSIKINLLFNLASQWDNQTNLRIAGFTSKIATITQRDSSSMIVMAAVTMLFLPGAFVSAIFSMVFFNTTTDSNGTLKLSVTPHIWMFPAVTVPLTLLVFLLWNRLRKRHSQLALGGVAAGSSPGGVDVPWHQPGQIPVDQDFGDEEYKKGLVRSVRGIDVGSIGGDSRNNGLPYLRRSTSRPASMSRIRNSYGASSC
ncbi:hypothetical protein CC2G_007649 [Coprinopsis cinerea AmutBmut pab1-1]|nr:hypothetical protein CC2G_007649 [Coprinopsis cinerea AmutBmut pab1-1]